MDIENQDDNRGNYTHSLTQQVQTEFPLDFQLQFPPFKGGKSVVFKCELKFSITNGNTVIWFESPDLKEYIDTNSEGMIREELKAFKDIVVIEI
jgi:uncharacterized protein YfdQ (DUF2303 family)